MARERQPSGARLHDSHRSRDQRELGRPGIDPRLSAAQEGEALLRGQRAAGLRRGDGHRGAAHRGRDVASGPARDLRESSLPGVQRSALPCSGHGDLPDSDRGHRRRCDQRAVRGRDRRVDGHRGRLAATAARFVPVDSSGRGEPVRRGRQAARKRTRQRRLGVVPGAVRQRPLLNLTPCVFPMLG